MNNTAAYITGETIERARQEMKKNKLFLIPNAYSKEFCASICEQIDNISGDVGTELNYGGTELRAWSAQKRSQQIQHFYNDANRLMSGINKKNWQAGTVLAIRNTPLNGRRDAHEDGRWHLDSWRSQEKVFLFLNDTDEQSGPFEFIPNTHHMLFRIKKALEPGFFFDVNRLFSGKGPRPYQSIADQKIESLLREGYETKPVIVKAGTVLVVNPSYLIHRARPCLQGRRYALTAYYGVKKGYKDFDVQPHNACEQVMAMN